MIVGTKTIDKEKLVLACHSDKDLEEYAISLVPRAFRHIPEIVSNQKYLVALEVRLLEKLRYDKRVSLCNKLLENVNINGVINNVSDIEDLLSNIDMDRVMKVLFKDRIKEVLDRR